jgi:hypothetical protein
MSVSNNDQVGHAALTDNQLAGLVQKALRHEYRNQHAAVKRIARKTGIEVRAIRNWYEGRKPPKAIHLLLLATHYPEILCLLIKRIGRADLWMAYQHTMDCLPDDATGGHNAVAEPVYSAKSCTINTAVDIERAGRLNQRQLWFLGLLQQGHRSRARDIMSVWRVSARAAKYDLAGLTDLNLIRFSGARKTGYYEATYSPKGCPER